MLRTIFLLANPLAIDKKNTLTCWTHWNAAKNISCGWKKGSGFISRQSPQWKWKYPEQPNWHVLLHLGQSLAISASSSTIKQLVGLPPGCPKSLDPRTGFFKHDQSVAFNMQISYKATEKTYNKHYLVQNCERKNLQILDLRDQQIEGPSSIYWFWHTQIIHRILLSLSKQLQHHQIQHILTLFISVHAQPGLNHANGKHHSTTCKSRYPSTPKLANMGFQTLHPFCPRVYLDPF